MNREKLSPALAALIFEYERFPEAFAGNKTRPQACAISAGNVPEATVFIYCEKDAQFENSAGINVNSGAGEVRTATVSLDKFGDLCGREDVHFVAASMQLKPLRDLELITAELNKYAENHPEPNGTDVIFGIVNSGVDVSQTTFSGRIHSIWDQTSVGNGEGYGKILNAESLGECTDGDGSGTLTAQIFADFAARFGANERNLIVVKTDFQNARLADAVHYIFDTAEKSGKTAVVNLNLEDFFVVQAETDDLSNYLRQETGARKIVIPIVGNDAARSNRKTVLIAPNKFSPAKFKFVVPSNSQPDSPVEVVVRGWFEANGECEITISSPNGGVTKSSQAEVLEGNPTRFGNYSSSQAFLTEPTLTPNGRREFFIDLRPIAPKHFVVSGTWKLSVKNTGDAEVAVGVLSWVHGTAKDVIIAD